MHAFYSRTPRLYDAVPLGVVLDNSGRVERVGKGVASTPIRVPVIQERVEPGNVLVRAWEARE